MKRAVNNVSVNNIKRKIQSRFYYLSHLNQILKIFLVCTKIYKQK